MKILQKIRAGSEELFRSYPALMTLCSLLPVLLTALMKGWGTPALTGIVFLLTVIFLFLTGFRHTFFRTVLPCFLLLCSLAYYDREKESDGVSRLLQFRHSAGVSLEMTLCDETLFRTGFPGEADLLDPPGRVLCKVTALGFSPEGLREKVSGRVLLVLPERFRKLPLCYGMRLSGNGVLRRAEPPLLDGAFDYRRYLETRQIRYLFYPEELVCRETAGGFRTGFFRFRDRILGSVLAGIRDRSSRAMAAGMLFGCRQGISSESRKEFLRSGLIHIFTVSGLHIGLFAAGVFLLLSFLKLPWRMAVGLSTVWIYGLMTGLQMPSLRALIMLSCWGVPRMFLLGGGGLNSVFFAGSILLICNGHQIREAGFHYSFLCVIFLVTGGRQLSGLLSHLREKELFHPERNSSFLLLCKNKVIHKLSGFLAGCFAAWCCSFLLTMYHQSMSTHLAMAANCAVLILAYGVFLVFTVFFPVLLFFPAAGKLAGGVLEKLLIPAEKICMQFSQWTGENAEASPGGGILLLLLVLLLGALCFSGRKKAVIFLCLLGVTVLLYCFTESKPGSELLLISGGRSGSSAPVWCISMPRQDFCCIGNLPDSRTAAELHHYLKRRGHNSLNLLVVSGTGSSLRTAHLMSVYGKVEKILFFREGTFSGSRFFPETPVVRETAKPRIDYGKENVSFRYRHGEIFFEILWKNKQISFDILQKVGKLSFEVVSGPGKESLRLLKEKDNTHLSYFLSGSGEHRRTVKRISF
ncbi:MAG: ComEC family competence protein [Lentisphaeria bacterium]|nr:ComEC family competence protein [Lentisphaeria bacterium]